MYTMENILNGKDILSASLDIAMIGSRMDADYANADEKTQEEIIAAVKNFCHARYGINVDAIKNNVDVLDAIFNIVYNNKRYDGIYEIMVGYMDAMEIVSAINCTAKF